MRPRDILRNLRDRYLIQFTGPNRAKRRKVEGEARRKLQPKAEMTKHEKHKMRKENKRRRKQKYGL